MARSGNFIPITWRNVTGPSNASANALLKDSGEQLGSAIEGLGTNVSQFADDKQKRETDEFISELNALDSDEERQDLLGRAEKGWLDMNQANTAVTEARAQDFLIADETRAQDKALMDKTSYDAKMAQDLLDNTHKAKIREREEAKFNRTKAARLQKEENDLTSATETALNNAERSKIRSARKSYFNSIKNAKTNQEKQTALGIFEKETSGMTLSAEETTLMNKSRNKVLNKYAQQLKPEVTNDFLKLLNSNLPEGTASFDNIAKVPERYFGAQLKTDLTEELVNKLMTVPGVTRETAESQASSLITKNNFLSLRFAEEQRRVSTELKLAGIVEAKVVKDFDIDMTEIGDLNRDPANFIADRISARIRKKHGTSLQSVDATELENLVVDTTEKIRSNLNYSNLNEIEQANINLGILRYMASIKYDPGWFDNDFGGMSTNDFTIRNNDVIDMQSHELLNGLQKMYPSNTKIGKLLGTATGKSSGTKTKSSTTANYSNKIQGNLLDNLQPKNAIDQYRQDAGEAPFDARNIIPDLLGVSEAHLGVKYGNNPTIAANTKERNELAAALRVRQNARQQQAGQELKNQEIQELLEKYKKGENYKPLSSKQISSSLFGR
jgi:hypothetical protein